MDEEKIVSLYITKQGMYDAWPYQYNLIIKRPTEVFVTPCYKAFYFKKRDDIRRISIYGGHSFIKEFENLFMTNEVKDITSFGKQQSANSKIKVILILLNVFSEHTQSALMNKLYNLLELELFK